MKFSLYCAAVASCISQAAILHGQAPGPAMLLPDSRALDVKHLTPQTQSMRVLVRAGSGDTTEREWSLVTRSDHVIEAPKGQMAQTFAYAPPRSIRDSLVVQRDGLAPVFERLDLGTSLITLRFEGNRVLGTVQRGDSTVDVERNYSHDVFAFNQLESLVRSLENAYRLLSSKDKGAFDISLEPKESLEKYGAVLVAGKDTFKHNRIATRTTRGTPFVTRS